MKKLNPVTPGELLLEEFLKPMGISQYRLAKEIGVPLSESAKSWLASGHYGRYGPASMPVLWSIQGYWLRAQAAYDTEVAEVELAPALKKIKPWQARKLGIDKEIIAAT